MSLSSKIEGTATEMLGYQDDRMAAYCTAAEQYVRALLRENVQPEELSEVYVYTCAVIVNLMFGLHSDSVTRLDAGAVSLSLDDRYSRMRQTVEQLLGPWCRECTAFVGVRA